MFPELFSAQNRVQPVQNYPTNLRRSLAACAPAGTKDAPVVAVLTPGIYNSAYFEHAFLADQMGVDLVEGPRPARGRRPRVAMRTTRGYKPIDVLYRRVDDDFHRSAQFQSRQPAWRRRASWMSTAPAASPSPTRRAPASPTTRRSIPTCPISSSSTPANSPLVAQRPHLALLRGRPTTRYVPRAIFRRTGGERGPRLGRLRHARSGPDRDPKKEIADFAQETRWRKPSQLHRPAHAQPVDRAHLLTNKGLSAAPRRPAPLRAGQSPTASRSPPAV